MKKLLWAFFLMCIFSMNAQFADAKGTNPVDQLTGKVWMESDREIKKAVLFGVDAAVAIEHAIAKKIVATDAEMTAEKVKMEQNIEKAEAIDYLSPFEQGWAMAFKDMSRDAIVETVDTWYTDNPDQIDRPVFNVIWFEIIEPKNK